MIRISKLTDYAFVVLVQFASAGAGGGGQVRNAPELAAQSGLPLPTVSKLLKVLTRRGLLVARRGPLGGYALSRSAQEISAAEIIAAVEGPVSVTECSSENGECECEYEVSCRVRGHWQRINEAIVGALQGITLEQLARPVSTKASMKVKRQLAGAVCASGGVCGGGDSDACTCGDHSHGLERAGAVGRQAPAGQISELKSQSDMTRRGRRGGSR